jgi:hypothetical protein
VAHYAFDRGERVFRQWNTSVIQIGRMCAIAPVAEVAVALQVFLAVSFLSRHTIVYRSTLLCVCVCSCGRVGVEGWIGRLVGGWVSGKMSEHEMIAGCCRHRE